MLLNVALTNNARESMEQYMEDLDENNLDEDPYEDWIESFTNSGELWWDFNESELTIDNINTLLRTSAVLYGEYGGDAPEDVIDLLRRFGMWQVKYGDDALSYRQMWDEMWNAKFNNQE
jgi:hypothetical protein